MKRNKSNIDNLKNLKNIKSISRAITIVENQLTGYKNILSGITIKKDVPVIGITGPPGAGKSTLVNGLISSFLKKIPVNSKGIGVVAIDPSSYLTKGALLGDRIRMMEHVNSDKVFIRSLSSRGVTGGLSEKTMEICKVMKAAGFDFIFIETVGVGQSEVEVAQLADIVLVVMTPESGDDIQVIKSGVAEIADIFVINKSDREGADEFIKILKQNNFNLKKKLIIVKTIATQGKGINELSNEITSIMNKLMLKKLSG